MVERTFEVNEEAKSKLKQVLREKTLKKIEEM